MSDWPVGLSTGSFYHMSIFDCLEAIRNGGFCLVEICSSPTHLNFHDTDAVKRVAALSHKLGIEAYSFHAPFIDVDISSPDPDQRSYSLQELLLAAEAASILGSRHFVIHPGPDRALSISIDERSQRLRNAAGVLDQVARRCHQLGVGLVLENMLPHLAFGNTADMLWILGAMQSLNVCTCLDTGHAVLTGDIYQVMYKLSGYLRLVHLNDNWAKGDDHLPPGKGIIDWTRLLFELSETSFHGGMILELSGTKDMETTLSEAREARLLIRSIARKLYLGKPLTVDVPVHAPSGLPD